MLGRHLGTTLLLLLLLLVLACSLLGGRGLALRLLRFLVGLAFGLALLRVHRL